MSSKGVMVGPHFDKDEANPLNAGQQMSSKKRVQNLKKKKANMQQSTRLDNEWKASMEAKVDSMVESMVEIRKMLHKNSNHSMAITYTSPSQAIGRGAPGTDYNLEMATALLPSLAGLQPTPPSLKLGYTKQTTTAPLEEYEEEQMIVGVSTSPQHMDEGENEEDSVKTCLDGTKHVDEGGNEEGRVEKVETGLDGIKQVDEGGMRRT